MSGFAWFVHGGAWFRRRDVSRRHRPVGSSRRLGRRRRRPRHPTVPAAFVTATARQVVVGDIAGGVVIVGVAPVGGDLPHPQLVVAGLIEVDVDDLPCSRHLSQDSGTRSHQHPQPPNPHDQFRAEGWICQGAGRRAAASRCVGPQWRRIRAAMTEDGGCVRPGCTPPAAAGRAGGHEGWEGSVVRRGSVRRAWDRRTSIPLTAGRVDRDASGPRRACIRPVATTNRGRRLRAVWWSATGAPRRR